MKQTLTAGLALLALLFPVWASAENPVVLAEAAKAGSPSQLLVRALLTRNQPEARTRSKSWVWNSWSP